MRRADRGHPEVARGGGVEILRDCDFDVLKEHGRPHFHAEYAGQDVVVEIDGGVVSGRLSPRTLRLVHEWAALHREELLENWARAGQASRSLALLHWSDRHGLPRARGAI